MSMDEISSVDINENEAGKWLSDHLTQIAAAWHAAIQEAGYFPLSPDELHPALQEMLEYLINEVSGGGNPAYARVVRDFVASSIDHRVALSNIMRIFLVLTPCIDQVYYSSASLHLPESPSPHAVLILQRIHLAINTMWESFLPIIRQFENWQKCSAFHLNAMRASGYNHDLEKLLRLISGEICKISDMWMCNSFLIPDFPRKGNIYYLVEIPPDAPLEDTPDLFMMEAFKHRKPVFCYDSAADPRTFKPGVIYANLKSLMAFPMIASGKPIAVGLITPKDYYHFSQDEIDQVMGIASSAAIAIENTRSYEMGIQLALTHERNQVAQELHDGFAQALAISKLNLNILLRKGLDEPTQTTLQTTKALVDAAYTDLRANIYGLRDDDCLEINLKEGIKKYITTFMALSDIEIDLAVNEEDVEIVPVEKVAQIARIVEEGLSNIRKHSRAKHAWINSQRNRNEVRITIEDDGIGVHSGTAEGIGKDHFGIKIMTERARLIGADLLFGEGPAGGTLITLILIC